MDHLDADTLGVILRLALDFRPALRSVCKRWAALLANARSPIKPSRLMQDGMHGLLLWCFAPGPPSGSLAYTLVAAALAGGARSAGAVDLLKAPALGIDFDRALCAAAERGDEGAVMFCKDQGVSLAALNSAMATAALCGHADVVRLCMGWGVRNPRGVAFMTALGAEGLP